MINISELKPRDIGKSVLYYAYPGSNPERGKITSWNDTYIFVSYASNNTHLDAGKATKPEDLEFYDSRKHD